MTVESNNVIAIATRSKTRASFSTNEKQNQNQSRHRRVTFPALGIVIGSWRCLFLLWLVGVIALVVVFRQSFENPSKVSKIRLTTLQTAQMHRKAARKPQFIVFLSHLSVIDPVKPDPEDFFPFFSW